MFTFYKTLSASSRIAITRRFSTQLPIRSVIHNSEIAARAFAACRCKRMIKFAVREKGPFVEYNPKLKKWIEEAKKCGLSQEMIDFSINITLDTRAQTGLHEMTFPGKGLILAQYEGVNLSFIIHGIMRACEQFEASRLQQTQRHLYYNLEGIVIVDGNLENRSLDDNDIEKISSVGATKVSRQTNEDGTSNFIIHCDPSHLHQINRDVKKMNYIVEEAYVGFAPKIVAKITTKGLDKIANLLLALSEIPEIDRLYENAQ